MYVESISTLHSTPRYPPFRSYFKSKTSSTIKKILIFYHIQSTHELIVRKMFLGVVDVNGRYFFEEIKIKVDQDSLFQWRNDRGW